MFNVKVMARSFSFFDKCNIECELQPAFSTVLGEHAPPLWQDGASPLFPLITAVLDFALTNQRFDVL